MSDYYLKFLINSFFLIAVLLLVLIVLKYRGNLLSKYAKINLSREIHIVDRVFLDRTSQLVLLKVKDIVLLLLVREGGTDILKEWKDEKVSSDSVYSADSKQ